MYQSGEFVAENENQYVVGAASSGSHFLAIGGSTGSFFQPGGGLYQTVKVTPNSLLSLSFDFDPNVGPPIVDLLDPDSLKSLGAFNKVITKGTDGWSTVSLQMVSVKDSLRVLINGTGTGSTRLRLDNVQLSAVAIPEPATWSTMSLGLIGIVACARLRRRQSHIAC